MIEAIRDCHPVPVPINLDDPMKVNVRVQEDFIE